MSLRIFAVIIAVVLFPEASGAQGTPRTELYLGFPWLTGSNSSQLLGVHGSVDVNATSWFGVRGEAGVHIGEAFAEKSLFSMVAGPVFSVRTNLPLRPFGHVLAGGAVSGCGKFDRGCGTALVFAAAAGGGIDFRLARRYGARIALDRLTTRFYEDTQRFNRISLGITIALGNSQP